MTYVITQNCCKDASCIPVCPVDCIRPADKDGQLIGTEMLYIDPQTCIDCGACLEVCPVEAIYYDADVPKEQQRFLDINAAYFKQHPLEPSEQSPTEDHGAVEAGQLRVAIVGSGPAACYAATELLRTDAVEIDVYERLPTPFGLIRAGVAPDHQHTKSVVDIFNGTLANPRVSCHFNVEIGRDITHAELVEHHHAVIYAVGAPNSRTLEIPGEELPGSHPAADFVGWYNGHPDHAADKFDLAAERAVIVGNGNVALDVARILLLPVDVLEKTDIAQYALDQLADSTIREVVILGRRGIREAAFSAAEFLALGYLPGIDIVIENDDLDDDADHPEAQVKLELAREYAARAPQADNKRITFRFFCAPNEFAGSDHITGIKIASTRGGDEATDEHIDTSLALRSIGYRGSSFDGLPFDDAGGIIPNEGGRVIDDNGDSVNGVYVTGWIKRGPRGVIGTNRMCAQETIAQLWSDFDRGRLDRKISDPEALAQTVQERGAEPLDWQAWRAIDKAERKSGRSHSRPRIKFHVITELLDAAKQ